MIKVPILKGSSIYKCQYVSNIVCGLYGAVTQTTRYVIGDNNTRLTPYNCNAKIMAIIRINHIYL